jgi:AmmeMemoRadiSam system radical SAM enzyme/AmmeMemoRadiSam system protein B/AmmeMemoRadiSam system protein A
MRVVEAPPALPRWADGALAGGWFHDDPLEPGRVICDLCPRACALRPGDQGFCFVRENRDGNMVLNTYGRSTGFCIDPIEKKPLNHFYPNTSVLSFGTAGCNLGCKFCQNWSISKSREVADLSETASPAAIAAAARQLGCESVAFTYNDPVVWAEYAIDTARACRTAGVKTVAVTAGYIAPVARGAFYEFIDAANVDLKGFTEAFYQKYTLSHLQPVLDTLVWLRRETNVWLEITNLVIPFANDERDELAAMCDWICEHLGPDVPVHFTAFHPDFRLRDRPHTPPETLAQAYELATARGLYYPYVGNVADTARQTTWCPLCRQPLVVRSGYHLQHYAIRDGRCAHCGTAIAGRYRNEPGTWGARRQSVRIAQYASAAEIGAPPVAGSTGGLYTIEQRFAAPQASPSLLSVPSAISSRSKVNPMSHTLTPTSAISPEAQQALLAAAGQVLAATTYARPLQLTDATLAGLAEAPVYGCFVTAKRFGRLRSCCGVMGSNVPLGQALIASAQRTANDDRRFPPLSPQELPYLDLDVWVLFEPQVVAARGESRRDAVVVGRHGLIISRGPQQGLLLPGVALEHELDAERFLQHVCLKAGLPPHAWKDDDVSLSTFEGLVYEGTFPTAALLPDQTRSVVFTSADVQQLCRWSASNITSFLTGVTPLPYAMNVTDGEASGVMFVVSNPTREVMHVTKFALHESLPVQATLLDMARQTAQVLASLNISREQLALLRVDLALFDDVAMHGTVASTDLRGVVPTTRAMIVNERNNLGMVFDGRRPAIEVYERAKELAEVHQRDAALVYSARVIATQPYFELTQKPTPVPGAPVRPAAVAGTFYPADPAALAQQVRDLLAGPPVQPQALPAALVPHAGLKYSGRVAAEVLRRVAIPETVVILGPKHTPHGVQWAVAPHEKWAIPGGELLADLPLAQALVAQIPGLQFDAAAHAQEHSIEIELPFLAALAPQAKVVGVVLGQATREKCREFARGLADVLRSRSGRVLLLISSDMNHYASDDENRRLDALALGHLENCDPDQLYQTCHDQNISMCGLVPAVIVLDTLRELGQLQRAERIAYATSADVTGDRSRVVGYAGMVWE